MGLALRRRSWRRRAPLECRLRRGVDGGSTSPVIGRAPWLVEARPRSGEEEAKRGAARCSPLLGAEERAACKPYQNLLQVMWHFTLNCGTLGFLLATWSVHYC